MYSYLNHHVHFKYLAILFANYISTKLKKEKYHWFRYFLYNFIYISAITLGMENGFFNSRFFNPSGIHLIVRKGRNLGNQPDSPPIFSSVQLFSHIGLFLTPWTIAHQGSCPLSWWCHPTISSSVVPFSSHRQSFPESLSFQVSQFFTLGSQNIRVSALASVPPMNIQGWFHLG